MAPDEPDRDVLSSLPRTRPQRRSAKRAAAPKAGAKAKPKAAAKPKPKAAAQPKAKAKPKAKAAPRARSAAAKKPTPLGPRRADRSGGRRRQMPPAGFSPPEATQDRPPPSAAELIGTAVQAAGELAQIGLAVGSHALRSALGRRSGS